MKTLITHTKRNKYTYEVDKLSNETGNIAFYLVTFRRRNFEEQQVSMLYAFSISLNSIVIWLSVTIFS